MKKFSFVLICLCLVGCATAYKMNRLNLGMTKQGVIKEMGQPNTTKAIGNNEILEYFLYLTGDDAFLGRTTPYWVGLEDGRVAWYGKAGDFGTALPEDRREYIIKNR